jgi:[acyl-carrier-protein] S-malonyltransferase
MPSSIALLFPGQGSHAEGMEDPYRGHPLMERGLELLGYDPFERLSEGTRYQQPALFLVSVAAWDAWRAEPKDDDDDAGEPIAAAGHSLGEYAALSTSAPTPWRRRASSAPAA